MSQLIQSNKNAEKSGEIGGKAKGLLFLEKHKFRVPPFFLLNFEILKSVLNGNESLSSLIEVWKTENNINPNTIWAVRSSAANEDGKEKSYAGLFTTEINVSVTQLEKAIDKVLSAFKALEKLNYNENEPIEFGIIIQEMIRSDYSGVIFSHNPLKLSENNIHINIIPGIGENLVSGKEEAFQIICKGNQTLFLNLEETYNGQKFSDKLSDISKSGTEIKKDMESLLPELIKGTQKLFKLKKYPIDIEFTIANNTIYWLQIRPITANGEEEISIWDNTNAEANYPEITMPLSISMVKMSFEHAYTSMGLFLGMDKKSISENSGLLKNMCGEIQGGLYYHVTAWQKLIYQLPFGKKASRLLPKMWGMEPADFTPNSNKISLFIRLKLLFKLITSFLFLNQLKKGYLENYKNVMRVYRDMNFKDKSYSELLEKYKDIQSKLGGNWAAPMINGFFTMLLFSSLKKISSKSRLNKKYPNFVNDILFAQGDVISVTIVREFQKLLFKIQQDENLLKIFQTETPQVIEQTLINNYGQIYSEVMNYINLYGERSDEGELKMETVNYKENPLLFIAFLKQNSTGKMNEPALRNSFNYNEILKKEYPFNFVKRIVFSLLIKNTINKVRDRENYRFIRTKTFGLIRSVFRAIDGDLLNKKIITAQNDSLYLVLEELTNPQNSNSFAQIISKRKAEYEGFKEANRVSRYLLTKNGFMLVQSSEMDTTQSGISGIGCCSGTVKAQVKIIDKSTPLDADFSGKILVADYFEPGKINLFSQAAGIISIRGNLLSHTAILCREMGIPSIVGAKGLFSKIKDDDRIEMNGATGKINIIAQDE